MLPKFGFVVDDAAYIAGGELILKCHKSVEIEAARAQIAAPSHAA
jgi:hypothetical protein